jgi:2-alkenal reductase
MKKDFRFVFLVSVLVLASLACQMIVPAREAPAQAPLPTVPVAQAQPVPIVNVPDQQNDFVMLYEAAMPGVVSIRIFSDLGGGQGSGFVYDGEGHIVTNFHVIEGADQVEVIFHDGFKARGTIIGTDIDSDLAIIKVDVSATELHPLQLGDSDQLKVGQTVIAIGNPFGLNGTMTTGIVSALGRSLPSNRSSGGGFFGAGGIIQTDAAINPGNSGGPLFNTSGEIVGINRAIRTDSSNASGDPVNSGISFAIASNIVKRVVPFIIRDGKVDYPYLGITSFDLGDFTIDETRALRFDRYTGVYILTVSEGTAAAQAGLIPASMPTSIEGLLGGGDLLIAIDGVPVNTYSDLVGYLFAHKSPGDQAVLTVLRGGQPNDVTITLGKRP